jgi:hypothetical protein
LLCGLAWLTAMFGGRTATAQPIRNRVLEGMSIERAAAGWRLRIRFSAPIRYLRHTPRDRGEILDVQLARIDGVLADPLPAGGRESLHVPRNIPIPLESVSVEGGIGREAVVHVAFSRAQSFRVLPGEDLRSLVVEIAPEGQASAQAASQAASLVQQGREAMTAGEVERAVQIFTKVISLPENPASPDARELLGLARERKGQLAHAVAEYRAYLERYPDGEGAERVRQRLATLVTARAEPEQRIRKPPPEYQPLEIAGFGSLYTSYRRESSFSELLGEELTDSSIWTDAFASLRIRSEAYTLRSEFSGGYRHEFLDGGLDEPRVSSLFLDLLDHERQFSATVGRRSRSTGGVLGRYDGVRLGKRFGERFEVSAVGGSPVYSQDSLGFESGRFFAGMALDASQLFGAIDAQIYGIHQIADGTTDRSAVGGEFRYFRDGRFLAGLLDYDVHFLSLNVAQLVGNWQVTPSLFLNALADYRNVPSISTSNALQGQLADDLDELEDVVSDLESLAEDRTAKALTLSAGASHSLAPDLQLGFDFSAAKLTGTEASGGIPAIEGTGFEFSYLAQLIANDLLRDRDVGVLGLRFFDGSRFDIGVASLDYRFPIVPDLRVNPRLAAELRHDRAAPDSFALRPRLRIDWRLRWVTLDAEAGVKWEVPLASGGMDDDWGYYATGGIRYDF